MTVELTAGVEDVVRRLEKDLDRWHVPGMELVVVRDGEPVFAGGVGVARLDTGAPVTSRTLFHHGSCGKAYTALLAVLLAEDGLLDLDAPIRQYIPELKLPDPDIAERMTVRDVLAHRSGLARHDLAWIFNPSWSRDEVVRRLEHLTLAGDIRAQWLYSNFGYTLAGIAVERVTGSTYEEQLQRRVLDAAGLTASVTSAAAARAADDHAEPYLLKNDQPVLTEWRDIKSIRPAGGVFTCADDSVLWLLLHLGAGPINASVVEKTHHLQSPIPPGLSPFPEIDVLGYGLGWGVSTYRGRRALWHTGGIDGFFTYVLLLPDQQLGFAASGNLHMAQLPFAAVLDIADTLLGETADTPWCERMHPATLAAEAEAAKATAEPIVASTPEPRPGEPAPPSHAVDAYAGIFTHPGYGEVTVSVAEAGLVVQLGEFPFVTKQHRHFDTWELRYDPLEVDATATFQTDAGGRVSSVELVLDEEADPVQFRRRGA